MRNLHLYLSALIVIPTAFYYADFSFLNTFFLVDGRLSVNMYSQMMAIASLYIGCAFIWILGVINIAYWKLATVLNGLFMSCLFVGRVVSFFVSGLPSEVYVYGAFGELILAVFAAYQFRKYASLDSSI